MSARFAPPRSEPVRPFWLAQALTLEARPEPAPLTHDRDVDVCIVGGGYTGLWTAIQLKLTQPELTVALIERDVCGAGASGRNGGCLLTLSTKYLSMRRLFGEAEALRLVRESEHAVEAITAFCRAHQIDADIRLDGALYTATSTAQLDAMAPVLAALDAAEANSWLHWPAPDVRKRAASHAHLEGHYSALAGSVHPGKLVRGLARVARQLGVQLFENTAMENLVHGERLEVVTPCATVRAGRVVLALNAWMATAFPHFERSIALVSSDMVITAPVPDLLAAIGLNHGTAVLDSRTFVHYYRSTCDGRVMLGKGGNTFAYGNRMLPAFDAPSDYEAELTRALRRFIPQLAEVPIAASWTGASDRSVTGLPFFGRLQADPRVVYGFGYSGNGVGPSYLGGLILKSLVLDEDNAWTRSGLATGPRGQFPPEPIRYVGALTVRDAIRRKEAREDAGLPPRWWDAQMAKLAAAAGKADKG